jgi:hypothetical protein
MSSLIRVRDCSIVFVGSLVAYAFAHLTQPPGAGRIAVAALAGLAFGRLLQPYIFQPEIGD